jgi:hypothetical protein
MCEAGSAVGFLRTQLSDLLHKLEALAAPVLRFLRRGAELVPGGLVMIAHVLTMIAFAGLAGVTGAADTGSLSGLQVAGAQPFLAPQDSAPPEIVANPLAKPSKDPYGKLFRLRQLPFDSPAVAPVQGSAALDMRVVCGLTIVRADPAIDRGFAVKAPDTTTEFKLRRIEPPVCRD